MRISLYLSFFFIIITLALSGCTATGPADDGWETSDGFKEGDGLFSKSDGGYQFGASTSRDRNDQEPQSPPEQTRETGQQSQIKYNTQAPTDYDTYLRWREARDNKSDEYERFQKWQEFEDYLRWKQSR